MEFCFVRAFLTAQKKNFACRLLVEKPVTSSTRSGAVRSRSGHVSELEITMPA